jgi:hypothetical protein
MRALVLTADPSLFTAFTEASTELGIEAFASETFESLSSQLSSEKYEGLVLDFDTIPTADNMVEMVRRSHSNQKAVIFAIASDSKRRDQALFEGAHFLLQRPVQKAQITSTLNAAYPLMFSEHRRYFRCAAELPVTVKRSGSEASLSCSTINLSSSGMALSTPAPLSLGEDIGINLLLPKGTTVSATGVVIWDDKHGKCGITYRCSSPEMCRALDAWLDSQFARVS